MLPGKVTEEEERESEGEREREKLLTGEAGGDSIDNSVSTQQDGFSSVLSEVTGARPLYYRLLKVRALQTWLITGTLGLTLQPLRVCLLFFGGHIPPKVCGSQWLAGLNPGYAQG